MEIIMNTYRKNNGWIMTEFLVALGLLVVIFAMYEKTVNAAATINRLELAKQRCIAAAQAQLDCMEATHEQIPEEDFQRLWPKMDISVEKSDGEGNWDGLTLIKVKTTDKSRSREVKIQLCRYMKLSR